LWNGQLSASGHTVGEAPPNRAQGTTTCAYHWLYRPWVQTQMRNKDVLFERFVSRGGALRHAAVPDGEHTMLSPLAGRMFTPRFPMLSSCRRRSFSPCSPCLDDPKLRLFHRARRSGWSPLSACGVAIGSVSQWTGMPRGLYSHASVDVHAAMCIVCD
jgi:hypothetical protein